MNLLLFCSNPVNGGTVRVFLELTKYFENNISAHDRVFPVTNINNPAVMYDEIPNIYKINIFSETELFNNRCKRNYAFRFFNKISRFLRYRKTYKRNIKEMKKFLEENRIDCVLIHNGGYFGDDLCNQLLKAAIECKKQVKGRIFVLHNDFEKNIISKIRYMFYDRFLCRSSTELVTVSNYTKNRLIDNSFINKEMQVLYNGLSEHNKLSLEEKCSVISIDKKQKNVLMLGNFQHNKGQLLFIDVVKVVLLKYSNVKFTIIGNVYDDGYYNECLNKIEKENLSDAIRIYTGINNASEYIDLFNILAVTSIYDESFGLISVEAMSKSTPVVAFACGGIPEVVNNGVTGYLVPIGDVQKMAERIVEILNNKDLESLLGKNGREEYDNKFSVKAMGERYYKIVEKYRDS